MIVLTQAAATVGAWLALLFVCTNLVGFFVEGLFSNPEIDALEAVSHDVIKDHIRQSRRGQRILTTCLLAIIVGFISSLYHFWNIGIALTGFMMMITRVPGKLWEMKYRRGNLTGTPPIYKLLLSIVLWACLPLLWFSIFRMQFI